MNRITHRGEALPSYNHLDAVSLQLLAASFDGGVARGIHGESLRVVLGTATAVLVLPHVVIGQQMKEAHCALRGRVMKRRKTGDEAGCRLDVRLVVVDA